MPETEDTDFNVEHNESYELTPEQFRKLVAKKFERNGVLLTEFKERESRLIADQYRKSGIDYGNEDRTAHYKHAVNGRPTGWVILMWIKKWQRIKIYSLAP